MSVNFSGKSVGSSGWSQGGSVGKTSGANSVGFVGATTINNNPISPPHRRSHSDKIAFERGPSTNVVSGVAGENKVH